jgi:hypothetical protein
MKKSGKSSAGNAVLRESMIREAAYFRAEQRSFTPGKELDDWFAAEQEIDAFLAQGAGAAAASRRRETQQPAKAKGYGSPK